MPPSLENYRWRVANLVLGGITLRNQGAPGVEIVGFFRTFRDPAQTEPDMLEQ